MPREFCRWRKFSQFVSDHVFPHMHRNELFSVMHPKRKTDHFRRDRCGTRPCLDNGLVAGLHHSHFLQQFFVNVWTFSQTSCHVNEIFLPMHTDPSFLKTQMGVASYFFLFFLFLRCRINLFVCFRFLVFTPSACFPHGVLGYFMPMGDRPSPPPCG